jgi:hypothetical protein
MPTMTKSPSPAGFPLRLDTQLIAAVQTRAGARVHESAGLLNAYRLSVDCYRLMLRKGDARATAEARVSCDQSEVRLRRFLASCA